MDNWDKFKETALPPKEAFYSKLSMSGVSNQDYEHTRRVWREFGINNFGEYHNLYLHMDWQTFSNLLGKFVYITMDWCQLTSI